MIKTIVNVVKTPVKDIKDCTKYKADAYGLIINHQIKFIGVTGIISLLIIAALYKKEQMNNKHEETMVELELEKMKLIGKDERGEENEIS